jgi:hypothetical protein
LTSSALGRAGLVLDRHGEGESSLRDDGGNAYNEVTQPWHDRTH